MWYFCSIRRRVLRALLVFSKDLGEGSPGRLFLHLRTQKHRSQTQRGPDIQLDGPHCRRDRGQEVSE